MSNILEKLTPIEKHGLFFIIIMIVMTIVTGGYWSGLCHLWLFLDACSQLKKRKIF